MTPFSLKLCLNALGLLSFFLLAVGEGSGQNDKLNNETIITWSTCLYQDMTKYLHQLVARHSNIARLYSIGKSVQGRDLWVVVISDHPTDRPLLRPQIKYVGNIIGNYGPSCYLLLRLITHMLTTFSNENSLERRLIEMNEIHVLPNMNPDGFNRSVSGACSGGHGRLNAAGFDLNRDFPDKFNKQSGKSQQPETQAVMTWIQSNSFALSISVMSGALVVTYPYDSTPVESNITGAHLTPDDDMFVHLAMTYVKNVNVSLLYNAETENTGPECPALKRTFRNGIVNGAEWGPASGTMMDYNYAQGTFEIMVAVSCCRNENRYSVLDNVWEANRQAMLTMALEVDYGIRGQVIDAETHLPVFNASLTKVKTNAELDDRSLTPIPWRTTKNGEFWRLILPGTYILEVRKNGYEVERIPFEVKVNHFTTIIVELRVKTVAPVHPTEEFDDDASSLDFYENGADSMSLNVTHALVNVSESTPRIQTNSSLSSKLFLHTILFIQALSTHPLLNW